MANGLLFLGLQEPLANMAPQVLCLDQAQMAFLGICYESYILVFLNAVKVVLLAGKVDDHIIQVGCCVRIIRS